MKTNAVFLFLLFFVFFSCTSTKTNNNLGKENCNLNKIKIKLSEFDENGLIGDEDGKVALEYEFCVPNNNEVLNEIKEIDSGIKPVKGKGRTKCSENSILLIGNSHQKDIKKILCKLSQLEYITEINPVYWE
ncbi:MAG: hypothetical protein IT232_07305 [Flavobacteriales bacterium]|nr:hypothetical protein [Flavobacteriales bacterium]